MGNVSFGVGIVNMRNDVKKSAMANALEKSIISAHERYFHGSPGNHNYEESVLYDCVVKYFNRLS